MSKHVADRILMRGIAAIRSNPRIGSAKLGHKWIETFGIAGSERDFEASDRKSFRKAISKSRPNPNNYRYFAGRRHGLPFESLCESRSDLGMANDCMTNVRAIVEGATLLVA
jgi:hypothetical protein